MKKGIATLCFALALLCMLTSCTALSQQLDRANAEELCNKINAAMSQVSSYRIVMEMHAVYLADGIKTDMRADMTVIEAGIGTEDRYHYASTRADVSYPTRNSKSQELKMLDAYYDGYTFESLKQGQSSRNIRIPMTWEQYLAYRQIDMQTEISFEGFAAVGVTNPEDGTWSMTYAQPNEQAIQEILEALSLSQDSFDATVTDINATVVASADYKIQSVQMEFSFDDAGKENACALTFTAKFLQYDKASLLLDELSLNKFYEIESLEHIRQVQSLVDSVLEQDKGSFSRKVSKGVMMMGQYKGENEHVFVDFDFSGDGSYAVYPSENKTDPLIRYANGVKTQTGQSTMQAKSSAWEYVRSLTGLQAFREQYITKLTASEDGTVYEITCIVPNDSTYKQAINNVGAEYKHATMVLTLHVQNGVLQQYTCVVEAKGSYKANSTSTYEVSYTETLEITLD